MILTKKVNDEFSIKEIIKLAEEFIQKFNGLNLSLFTTGKRKDITSTASKKLAVIIPNSGEAEKESIFDDTHALFEWWMNREIYGIEKEDKRSQALNIFKQKIRPDNNKNSAPLNSSKGILGQKKYYSLIKELSQALIDYWTSKSETSKSNLTTNIDKFNEELLGHFRDSSTSFNERDNIDILIEYIAEYDTRFKNTDTSKSNYNKNSISLKIERKSILKKRLLFISSMNDYMSKLIDDIVKHRKFHTGIKTQYGYDFISTNKKKNKKILDKINIFGSNETRTVGFIENEMNSLFEQLRKAVIDINTQIKTFDLFIISMIQSSKETFYEINLALGSLVHVVNIIQNGNDGMLIDVQDEVFYYVTQIANRYTLKKIIPICDGLFKSYLKEKQKILRVPPRSG
ncbi:hypothetical protein BB560_006724 [Smittium megazygosporum]|uniref:Uncharacterized protein n=1 Tax=Smittium megazygosporum TaxID=133381 RepID=A0A2T9Y248_9FUNG|nr:hypothetical protein BB560_006724 [Smittium megazygosporum]